MTVSVMRLPIFIVILCCLWLVLPTTAQVPTVPTTAPGTLIEQGSYIRSDQLGITFISSIDSYNNADRYRNALILGAGWNRWPLYWDRVEVGPKQWNWSAYDELVETDLDNGLNINAILLGRPTFRQDGTSIQGLNEPIYADSTDSSGGEINPNNYWAQFVSQAVNRYRPGGILAQQRGLDDGVRVWEVWNEPDFALFWQGGVQAYARMLKVSAIVIKDIDPSLTVMFGGLLYSTDETWLTQTLNIFQSDPLREDYNWFMDVVAIHSYDDPWRSAWLTLYVRQSLKAYGLERPIWLNETGVSVWNDYPGPVWSVNEPDRIRLATSAQQAHYLIQSATYAWSEGADKIFFHQLYDDCGNQPAGTDFPPNNGEICGSGPCFGDAFGIYRNPSDAICFSQHPFANTPRPVATAYRLLAEVFGRETFSNGKRDSIDGQVTVISFDRPETGERILVIWNETFEPVTFPLTPTSESATIYTLQGTQSLTPSTDGYYYFDLPPATSFGFPDLDSSRTTAIGGEPIIVVESDGQPIVPAESYVVDVAENSTVIRPTIVPTVGAITLQAQRPTVVPEDDVTPPTPTMQPLPAVSPDIFTVKWEAEDDGGIQVYLVWVRIDGGDWLPWLETTSIQSDYAGESGRLYEFSLWAQDYGGNWSTNTELQPMTSTQVE